MYKIRKSFTLIEMLIVIVIIGILAAALVPRLADMQARSRDTRRKIDVKTISTALSLYRADFSDFPPVGDVAGGRDVCVETTNLDPYLISGGYLSSMPKDVKYFYDPAIIFSGNNYCYRYRKGPGANTGFLYTRLENRTDPDTITGASTSCAGLRYRTSISFFNYCIVMK